MARKAGPKELMVWDRAKSSFSTGLRTANKDLVAYECLANSPLYAKPDIEKSFILWEVPRTMKGLEIVEGAGVKENHAALYKLFITSSVVRFPFNVADSQYGAGKSLSWEDTYHANNATPASVFYRLPRWSTASRSNFALIPARVDALESLDGSRVGEVMRAESADDNRYEIPQPGTGRNIFFHLAEWQRFAEALGKPFVHDRFYTKVKDPGSAARDGILIKGTNHRLYSIKTGISYVGSKDELGAHKNRLESNSALAMLRSDVMRALPNHDPGFGLQTEILTITAPALIDSEAIQLDDRDGFQVRDLSCMKPGLVFLPAQAIPFVRHTFDMGYTSREVLAIERKLKVAWSTSSNPPDHLSVLGTKELDPDKVREQETDTHVKYWYDSFTYPLGRAKARLFLNYGLIHTSANAQNFVLGFKGRTLEQFMVRDVGDTSWHDIYIARYAGGTKVAKALAKEGETKAFHLLKKTSSDDYPAPYIVRLAAWSLLTHDFDENMKWNDRRLYKFIHGIFDGFMDYIAEVLGAKSGLAALDKSTKKSLEQPTADQDIKKLGTHTRYPFSEPKKKDQAYRQHVDECLKSTASQLLTRAAAVHKTALTTLSPNATTYEFADLVATEETLLCAAVERLFFHDMSLKKMKSSAEDIVGRMKKGVWPAILV